MLGCCGIDCAQCGAFQATAANDDAQRRRVAADWSARYHTTFTLDQINCVGCTAEGCHVGYAERFCAIRQCCLARHLPHCARCDAYPCGILGRFHAEVPAARAHLQALRG